MILCTEGNHWTKTVSFCGKCQRGSCKQHGRDVGQQFFCDNCIRVFGEAELNPAGRPYSNMPASNPTWERENPFREYIDGEL